MDAFSYFVFETLQGGGANRIQECHQILWERIFLMRSASVLQVPTKYCQITNLCEPVLLLWCGSLSRIYTDSSVWSGLRERKLVLRKILGKTVCSLLLSQRSGTSCVALTVPLILHFTHAKTSGLKWFNSVLKKERVTPVTNGGNNKGRLTTWMLSSVCTFFVSCCGP